MRDLLWKPKQEIITPSLDMKNQKETNPSITEDGAQGSSSFARKIWQKNDEIRKFKNT